MRVEPDSKDYMGFLSDYHILIKRSTLRISMVRWRTQLIVLDKDRNEEFKGCNYRLNLNHAQHFSF